MISKFAQWLSDVFDSFWSAHVSAFKWLVEKVYNAFVDLLEAIFARMVDLFISVLEYFPDYDLSGFADGCRDFLALYGALDELLPITEILLCASLYITFSFAYGVVRVSIKLIPTIG